MTSSHLENETIVLSRGYVEDENCKELIVHISRTANVILPAQLLIPKNLQTILCVAGWCFMLLGSSYRLVVYKHIFNELKKKSLSPINVLIIFSCLIQHVGILSSLIYETLVVYNGENLQSFTGYEFCLVARFMFGLELIYSFISSLGIAVYRILLIKQDIWVKYKIGETNLMLLILLSGLILAVCAVVMLINADGLSLFSKKCVMVPGSDFLGIIGDYQQSLGRIPSYFYYMQIRRCIAVTLMSMTLVEIIVYILFFHHLYRNDNSDTLIKALGPNVIKARNKTNALTFFSQFCSFVFQISVMVLMLFASFTTENKEEAYLLATFLKKLTFGIIAVIEVLTSRKNLKATPF